MLDVVAVVFHKYELAPDADNVVPEPIMIETLEGEITTDGNEFIITVSVLLNAGESVGVTHFL